MSESDHDPRETDAFHRGQQEADIRSLHYRLDEVKSMLQQHQEDHRREMERLDSKIEERLRPLERFKSGLVYVGSLAGSLAAVVAGLFTFKIGGGKP